MVPNQAPKSSTTRAGSQPLLVRSTTLPVRPLATNPALLAPEDAIYQGSPPRKQSAAVSKLQSDLRITTAANGIAAAARLPSRGRRPKDPSRSRSRRRKGNWSKLLWVKQSYPDNYTDQDTFLEHLQRNPRLQPYDFWPLVADSTVIVQHVCSVIIFVVCFIGIFQGGVSPGAVVGWGSFATFLGWLIWDWWVGQEEAVKPTIPQIPGSMSRDPSMISAASSTSNLGNGHSHFPQNLVRQSNSASVTSIHSMGVGNSNGHLAPNFGRHPNSASFASMQSVGSANSSNNLIPPLARQSNSASLTSIHSMSGQSNGHGNPSNDLKRLSTGSTQSVNLSANPNRLSTGSVASMQSFNSQTPPPRFANNGETLFSHRTSLRLSTAKSALLIYFTLLGLSPILKSLTRSTSSDSIWAMSFLLFTINIFFFDYGSPAPSSSLNSTNKNIPASLSTNAALMASTVLASRLPSTGQVFSLTLFSIEVFGLFPVFRRYARQRSWRGHVALTMLLVLGAGGGVGLVLGRGGDGEGIWDFPWKSGIMGLVIGVVVTGLAMGGCSWWLIGLQKYKNEIHGPWDPARPIIRRSYDYDF